MRTSSLRVRRRFAGFGRFPRLSALSLDGIWASSPVTTYKFVTLCTMNRLPREFRPAFVAPIDVYRNHFYILPQYPAGASGFRAAIPREPQRRARRLGPIPFPVPHRVGVALRQAAKTGVLALRNRVVSRLRLPPPASLRCLPGAVVGLALEPIQHSSHDCLTSAP